MNNFKTMIDSKGTTYMPGRMNYLRMMLCVKYLQEFDDLASQNNGTTKYYLKFIQEGLFGYFPK